MKTNSVSQKISNIRMSALNELERLLCLINSHEFILIKPGADLKYEINHGQFVPQPKVLLPKPTTTDLPYPYIMIHINKVYLQDEHEGDCEILFECEQKHNGNKHIDDGSYVSTDTLGEIIEIISSSM